MTYEARHGQGFSTFRAKRGPLSIELTQIVDPRRSGEDHRGCASATRGSVPARLRVYAYAEWVLGSNRSRTAPTIVPSQDAATGALLAQNPYSLDFGDRVAFLAGDGRPQSVTADRARIHRHGTAPSSCPHAVAAGAALSGRVEAGGDPCAAIASDIEIPRRRRRRRCSGCSAMPARPDEASALVADAIAASDFDERLADNERDWRGFLDTLQVETPDKALDAMVNHWLPYQSLACRIRARSAFYQASGAFGFRDQLQDTLALLLHDPELARDADPQCGAPAVPRRRRAALVAAAHRRRRAHA